MSIIKRVEIANWIGISELSKDLGKINVISGHKGSGKTSIIEAIEKAFTNKNRRTEVVKHGETEATIFVETSDGLEIGRKIRTDKADYLKIRKDGEAVPSTEAFLRKLISGDIFRPLEFVVKKPDEQAKIILNMLEIPWTMSDINAWFGEIPKDVNYQAHILQVLKQIENHYYNEREAINREIKILEAQVKGIRDELPANYDGEEWRNKNLADYYKKVNEAEETNRKIEAAKQFIEGLESKIETIKANAETEKEIKKRQFDNKRSEGREFIQFLKQKIEKSQAVIDGFDKRIDEVNIAADLSQESARKEAILEYEKALAELKAKHEAKLRDIDKTTEDDRQAKRQAILNEVDAAKAEISKIEQSIAAKEQELLNIDELEQQALMAVDEKAEQQIEHEKSKTGNVEKYLEENQPIDVQPLKEEAEKVANMQSYLREYDRMIDIIQNRVQPKKDYAAELTRKIEKSRELPQDLLKTTNMPIPGLSVDGEGRIRIGETLISDLSEGEQLELAFRVAKAQAGELKVICIDGINKINESDRKWLEEEMQTDEYQYFILNTVDGDLNIEIIK